MKIIMPVWAIDDATINITENAIESLKGNEILIVDNGSTVGAGKLREMSDIYIRLKQNMGYAKAVNIGLKQCLMETVAIANNDIRVSPNWETVSKEIMDMDGVGSVHFRMIPYDQPFNPGTDVWTTGKERWCSSSFFVVRAVQLYDEGFLNSLDDLDYWRRFREKGFKTAYTNKAEYQHMDSFTQQKIEKRSENDMKNHEYYRHKYGETSDEWLMRMYPDQMLLPWKPFP